jgi:3',5'-cyclic AMP phosphodiesterase CpdA
MAVRLVHFSDVHLAARVRWTPRDYLSKKLTGWVNVRVLGRGRRFRHAPAAATALAADLRTRGYDHLVFSGDASTLAFDAEMAGAAAALGVGAAGVPPGIAVAGNHDYYTRWAFVSGSFEKHFQPWQDGLRVDGFVYPFAQRVGPLWLIGMNSSRANWWTWDASGKVGEPELLRLRKLCSSLGPGPRVLVTHYPIRTAAGKIERRSHQLRDHRAALAAAVECGVGLWLHGHIHRGFVFRANKFVPFPAVCAGSATQTNRWSYCEYTIDGTHLAGRWRRFDLAAGRYTDGETFELDLPAPHG